MPSPEPTLTIDQARERIAQRAFADSSGDRVGIELEWLTHAPSAPADPPPIDGLRTAASAGQLPGGSAVSIEPGGQIEISTPPQPSAAQAVDVAGRDADELHARLAREGLATCGAGLDPVRPPHRVNDDARYAAMEAFFAPDGPDGYRMMCSTASIHINIDAGADELGARRWRLAHALGPTLLAMFANSPMMDGAPTGWRSTRFRTWLGMDRARSAPVSTDGDPAGDWASYALDANVMLIRTDGGCVGLPDRMSLGAWITSGHELGYPTADDVDYHLTTLFPPVRPRRWIELRMIDMLPAPWWRAAVEVSCALLAEPTDDIDRATAATAGCWTQAARAGLDDPAVRRSAETVAGIALDRLGPQGVAAAFVERFTSRGRCPADEISLEEASA